MTFLFSLGKLSHIIVEIKRIVSFFHRKSATTPTGAQTTKTSSPCSTCTQSCGNTSNRWNPRWQCRARRSRRWRRIWWATAGAGRRSIRTPTSAWTCWWPSLSWSTLLLGWGAGRTLLHVHVGRRLTCLIGSGCCSRYCLGRSIDGVNETIKSRSLSSSV